jgi:hypothetical protein
LRAQRAFATRRAYGKSSGVPARPGESFGDASACATANCDQLLAESGVNAVMIEDSDRYGATLYGLGALQVGTEVTIVFLDAKGVERLVDSPAVGVCRRSSRTGQEYFYCLSAVRVVNQGKHKLRNRIRDFANRSLPAHRLSGQTS